MFVCVHVCGHDMLRMTPRVKDGVSCLGHTVTRCLFVYVCVFSLFICGDPQGRGGAAGEKSPSCS